MSDLISRQAVEDITWEEPSYSDPLNVLTEVREKVRALPSVENKGEWENSDSVLIVQMGENTMRLPAKECSICHKPHIKGYGANFCPNCGADMRGDKDDN